MSQQRRKCYLANSAFKDTDLRQFEEIIVETINTTVPGKHPKVYKEYFSTETILRLFRGKVGTDEDNNIKNEKQHNNKPKGGRMK